MTRFGVTRIEPDTDPFVLQKFLNGNAKKVLSVVQFQDTAFLIVEQDLRKELKPEHENVEDTMTEEEFNAWLPTVKPHKKKPQSE